MGKASVLIVLSDSIIQGRLSLFQFKFQNLHKIFYALLINEAKDYHLANIVRDYIDACKGQDPDRVAWMQGVADWLDPLVSGNNPYLEKRQHGASDEQKASYLGEESSHNDSFLNYLDML